MPILAAVKPRPARIPLVLPNYTHGFSRWVKTPLSPRHKAIIRHIERARQTATPFSPVRIIIEDSDPGASGIPQLLVRYMQWLTTRILPDRRALIIAPSACRKALPLSSSRSMRLVSPIRLISPIKPERLRGLQFDMALLLDAHRYRRLSGFASRGDDFYLYGLDRFSDLLRFIIPMLPAHRDGILIIHGRPSRRVTGFQSIRRLTLANLASYTLLGHNAREDNKIPLSIPPVRLIRPIGLIGTAPHPLLKTLKTLNPLPALIPAAPPIPTFAKVA